MGKIYVDNRFKVPSLTHWLRSQDESTAKRNFKFGVNIILSQSRWATLYTSSAIAGQRGRERRGLQVTLPRIPLHHDLMRPNLNRRRGRERGQRAIGQNASIARRVTCFFGRGGNVILEVGAVRSPLPNVTSLGIAVDYRHSSPFACDFERARGDAPDDQEGTMFARTSTCQNRESEWRDPIGDRPASANRACIFELERGPRV